MVFIRNDFSRHSGDSRSGRNIFRNHSPCSYRGIIANVYIFHDTNRWADIDIISDNSRSSLIAAYRQKLTDVTIVSNHGSPIYHDTDTMPDIKSISYFYSWRYLYPVFP